MSLKAEETKYRLIMLFALSFVTAATSYLSGSHTAARSGHKQNHSDFTAPLDSAS